MRRTEMYMSEDMLESLNEISDENEVSRAEVVRTLVEYGLEHQDNIDFGEDEKEEEDLECSECGATIDSDSSSCPECGEELTEEDSLDLEED